MESLAGQTVSHYVFLEKLGAGGMGEIYRARDSRLNRMVAVKVLSPGKTHDPERRRRFIQEAQAASALNHPNIITIHDILPEGDTQYMVMELVAGKTLHELISGGRLPIPQVLQLATQMANALAVAHAAGIIHRDFKPANVMVTGYGLVKILDFGLAKLTDLSTPRTVDGVQDTLTAAPLTREGSIMGTVNYMSPEQAEGLKVDHRSDIFSFGAVLYEMVTGQRAFDGDSGISALSAVLRDEVKPIHEIAPEVPAELADIVNRCLRKSPAARWQSMNEVEAELSNLKRRSDSGVFRSPPASSMSPVSSPPRTGQPVSKPIPAGAAAVSAPTNRVLKLVSLGFLCLAIVVLAILTARWSARQKQLAVTAAAPAPAASSSSTSQPAPSVPDRTPATTAESAPTNDVPPAAPAAVAAPPSPTPAVAPPPVIRSPAPDERVLVKLNDGLPLRIALLEDVPAGAEVGRPLRFRVLDGIQSGDTVVIAKGSIVTGSVADSGAKRNFFGERKPMKFSLISAESVDGTKINVRATPAPGPNGVEARSFATPNAAKQKGSIAVTGAEYVAYISGDQTVSMRK
jgi:serine/threonine protein kinase